MFLVLFFIIKPISHYEQTHRSHVVKIVFFIIIFNMTSNFYNIFQTYYILFKKMTYEGKCLIWLTQK